VLSLVIKDIGKYIDLSGPPEVIRRGLHATVEVLLRFWQKPAGKYCLSGDCKVLLNYNFHGKREQL